MTELQIWTLIIAIVFFTFIVVTLYSNGKSNYEYELKSNTKIKSWPGIGSGWYITTFGEITFRGSFNECKTKMREVGHIFY